MTSTPAHHLVLGAGPVGSTLARLLAEQGHAVTVATRSGSGPDAPEIRRIALDANDTDAVARVADGAATIYNCVNPPYGKWAEVWPGLHASMMQAASRAGAALVMMDNLYAFGPGTAMPMTEASPMLATGVKGATRAALARELLDAHAAGTVRGALVRASDFFGPEVVDAGMGERDVPRLLAGKKVSVLGALDVPHSFSYMPDVAATLAAVGTSGSDSEVWGRPWHVPNAEATTQREFLEAMATAAGVQLRAGAVPAIALRVGGVFVSLLRELRETEYQFTQPFVTDSSLSERVLGVRATPLDVAAKETVDWWRNR